MNGENWEKYIKQRFIDFDISIRTKGANHEQFIKKILFLITTGIFTAGLTITTLAAGREQLGDGWYYRGNSGEYLKNNWVYSNGKNYYLGADGKMLTDGQYIVYRICIFDESGALVEESMPVYSAGLDYNDLCQAQRAVREYWPAIEKAYEMVNAERQANGSLPTILNYDLCVAAAYRSIEMEKKSIQLENGPFYSGPENERMLWDSASIALTGDANYLGTENKSLTSYSRAIPLPSDRGVSNMVSLLKDQFLSVPHYTQIIGREYGQIGIAIVFLGQMGKYQNYRITEEIKIGEINQGDLVNAYIQ